MAAAAKLCYSDQGITGLLDSLDADKTAGFIAKLMDLGHESPLEHANFTFAIEGVSRSLLAQITRHRIASFSVQSQRYVRFDNCEYVIPPQIAADAQALLLFEQAMRSAHESYKKIADILKENHYKTLTQGGMSEKRAEQTAEKRANEDARFVLPNAAMTKMIITMNARSLRNFFALRCCERAQWEIRRLADEMLRLAKQAAPILFIHAGPPCVNGPCPEGEMSCGKSAEIRARYKGGLQ